MNHPKFDRDVGFDEVPEDQTVFVYGGIVGDRKVDEFATTKPCEQRWCCDCPTLLWITKKTIDLMKERGINPSYICPECSQKRAEGERAKGEEVIEIKP